MKRHAGNGSDALPQKSIVVPARASTKRAPKVSKRTTNKAKGRTVSGAPALQLRPSTSEQPEKARLRHCFREKRRAGSLTCPMEPIANIGKWGWTAMLVMPSPTPAMLDVFCNND